MKTSRRDFLKTSSAVFSAMALPSSRPGSTDGLVVVPDPDHGRYSLSWNRQSVVSNAIIVLEAENERIASSDPRFAVSRNEEPGAYRLNDRQGMFELLFHHEIKEGGTCLLLNVTVTNTSQRPVHLKTISPLVAAAGDGSTFRFWNSPDDIRVLTDSWERCYGEAGVKHLRTAGEVRSAWDLHLIDLRQHRTLSIGYSSVPLSKLSMTTSVRGDGAADLSILCDTRSGTAGITIAPGRSFSTGELMIRIGQGSAFETLESYAALVARWNRISVPRAIPVGWVDWYFAKATTTEEDVLRNIDFIASELKDFGLEYVQLDSGWQLGVETEPPPHNVIAGGPWTPNSRFPRGMKWYAENIKERGLKPGIWVRPFEMISTAGERARHPEWFNEHGQMDFSHPGVQEYVRTLFRMLTEEWGYEYIKYDFPSFDLFGAWGKDLFEVHSAREQLYDPAVTNIEAYRSALTGIRQAAGSTPLLACNSLMAPTLGLSEVFRIGDDVGDWNRTFIYGVKSVSARYYTNGRYWANDPDVLLVREPFTLDQARMWASLIALSGGVVFISERLHELPAERLDILKKSMPVYQRETDGYAFGRPLDLLEKDVPEVWCLEVRKAFADWRVLGLFNWSEESIVKSVDLSSVGDTEEYLCYEFWGEQYHGPVRGTLTSAIPPLSCKLFTLHRPEGRPQFISSSRHITQGGVDLQVLEWMEGTNTLHGTTLVVRNNPTVITIAAPPSFRYQRSTEGVVAVDEGKGVVRVTMQSPTTGPVQWSVAFTRL